MPLELLARLVRVDVDPTEDQVLDLLEVVVVCAVALKVLNRCIDAQQYTLYGSTTVPAVLEGTLLHRLSGKRRCWSWVWGLLLCLFVCAYALSCVKRDGLSLSNSIASRFDSDERSAVLWPTAIIRARRCYSVCSSQQP